MSPIEQDKLMNSITFKIHRLVIISDKIAEHNLQSVHGFGLSQFLILYVLHFFPGTNQRLVAENLGMSGAAVSKHIEKLEKLELLEKSAEQADRRQHYWQLTSEGEQLMSQMYKTMDGMSQDARSVLEPKEREIFKKCLDKILNYTVEDFKAKFPEKC